MNEQFTVIRSFQDKYTNENYSVGQNFNAEDQQRAKELESGGYIAPTNSTMAKDAMAQAENAQANSQALAQAHIKAANNAEPKTVLNGKVVPLKVAQAAESAFDESNTTTGIREHHDNTTESVPAGQIASRSQSTAESAEVQANQQSQQQQTIKQANMQSGQQGVQQHLEQAQKQMAQAQQQLEQQMQQAQGQQAQGQQAQGQQAQGQQQGSQQQQQAERQALAAAAEKTNPMAAEHETAAEMQQAAAKATAKARAKKE